MSDPGYTLVTGASRRVGKALATAILDGGHAVIAHSRAWDTKKVDTFSMTSGAAEGLHWIPWAHDFSAPCPALPDVPIRHLILNASTFEQGQPWAALTSPATERALLARHLQINVIAQWELAIAVAARGHLESIVMVLDTYYDRPLPGHAAYQVSRAAGAGLVRALASELAPVRVNAVAPGTVLWSERAAAERAETEADVADRSVLGAIGSVHDVVEAVLYLRNASFVTGEILRVDGGRWKP